MWECALASLSANAEFTSIREFGPTDQVIELNFEEVRPVFFRMTNAEKWAWRNQNWASFSFLSQTIGKGPRRKKGLRQHFLSESKRFLST